MPNRLSLEKLIAKAWRVPHLASVDQPIGYQTWPCEWWRCTPTSSVQMLPLLLSSLLFCSVALALIWVGPRPLTFSHRTQKTFNFSMVSFFPCLLHLAGLLLFPVFFFSLICLALAINYFDWILCISYSPYALLNHNQFSVYPGYIDASQFLLHSYIEKLLIKLYDKLSPSLK